MHDEPSPVRCVIYAAKSTDDRHGSIETQIAACEEYAERNGWALDGEPHKDNAKSGYHQSRGKGLAQAKEHAARLARDRASEVVLLVADTDRLARGDAIEAAHLVEHWLDARKAGYRIDSVGQNLDGEMGLLLATVYGERAHADSKAKSRHVKRGVRRRVENGHMHGGYRPYGFGWQRDKNNDNDPGKLVEIPEQVAVVRHIFDRYAEGVSQGRIADLLDADEIAPPRGSRWDRTTIALMLRNRTYVGDVKLKGEWFPGRHEAIIDPETWERVQARLTVRSDQVKRGLGRPPAGRHLLVGGILRCGRCGGAMRARTYRHRSLEVYMCATRNGHGGSGKCDMPQIRREWVDDALLEHFEEMGLDAERSRQRLTQSAVRMIEEAQVEHDAAEREVTRSVERLARVRRSFQDGKLDEDDYLSHRDELTAEKAAAEAEASRWAERVQELEAATDAIDSSAEWAERLDTLRRTVAGELQPGRDLEALRAAIAGYFREIRLERGDDENDWCLVPFGRKLDWIPTEEDAAILRAAAAGGPIDGPLPGPRVTLDLEPSENSEITSQLSRGTNQLLRLGATPATCVEDVLAALGIDPAPREPRPLEPRLARVRAAVAEGASAPDALARRLDLAPSQVAAALAELELLGLVMQADGLYREVVPAT